MLPHPRIWQQGYMKPWAVQPNDDEPLDIGLAATFVQLPVMSCEFASDSHPFGRRTHARLFHPQTRSIVMDLASSAKHFLTRNQESVATRTYNTTLGNIGTKIIIDFPAQVHYSLYI
jgi:hypothetical protein